MQVSSIFLPFFITIVADKTFKSFCSDSALSSLAYSKSGESVSYMFDSEYEKLTDAGVPNAVEASMHALQRYDAGSLA